jgi:LemA protein
MSATLLTWTLVAITVFWCVGLYQRISRLRAVVLEGLVLVEKQLTRYIHLVEMQLSDVEIAPVAPQWEPLFAVVRTLQATSQAARSKPFIEAELQTLSVAIDSIREQVERLRMPRSMQKMWQEAAFSVTAERVRYNDDATQYNEALHQFPARLVVGLMGFKVAVRL